ncbi:trimeric intracellular cation channel family protein [uncultured Clostridium sp.]|uniref:trimeric intracellular cation channel family protein n=1 Tax=uncultured Clostridium sp. TaxID=59620 RepID=UPI00321733CF
MLLIIFEVVGTVAFAISGALVGMQKKLDLFGVIFLGIITAIGGGIFRDVTLGQTPPAAFINPTYFIISMVVSIMAFYGYPKLSTMYTKSKRKEIISESQGNKYMSEEQILKIANKRKQIAILKKVILILDSIGLATFTISGANLAFKQSDSNIFLVVCMGLITGVGGGILRDTFVQDTPMIFKKEIYAVASILGASVFYLFNFYGINYDITFWVCFTIILLCRAISIRLNLNLPIFNSDKYNINL